MLDGFVRTTWRLSVAVIAVSGALLLAGCGDEETSGETFSQQVNERTRAVAQLFSETFQGVAAASMDAGIGEPQKAQLQALAERQRQAAEEIAALDPPEGAGEATAQLVQGLREHAGRLEAARRRENLTFDGLTAATAPPPELTKAITEFRSEGIDVVAPLPGAG